MLFLFLKVFGNPIRSIPGENREVITVACTGFALGEGDKN